MMKKFTSKIVLFVMIASLFVLPTSGSAAQNVTLDNSLGEYGFTSYNGTADMNAACTVVDSGESSHGKVLQIAASGNADRSNRYGGVQYNLSLQPGTYRIICDYKTVGQNGTDIGRQFFMSLATSTHGAVWGDMVVYPEATTDWKSKNYKITVSSAGTYKVQFGVAGNYTLWVDNIVVRNEANKLVNLLPTYDFSSFTGIPRDFVDIFSDASGNLRPLYELVTDQGKGTSLKVTQNNSGENGNDWVGIRHTIPSSKLVQGHTYYFGFSYKKDSLNDSEYTKVMRGFGNDRGPRVQVQGSQGDAMSWTWHSNNSITCTNVNNFGIDIIVQRNASIYLDDLCCYDQTVDSGHTNNLIPHGDFEPYLEVEDISFATSGKATAQISNQSGTSRDVIMIAGAYDASMNLKQVVIGTQNTFAAQDKYADTYTAEVDLPTVSADSIYVYVWDNLTDINALRTATRKP